MPFFRQVSLAALVLFVGGPPLHPPSPVPVAEPAVREHAMVVCAHPLATEVGVQVLRDGGNAVDAAVAVQFALAVVLPWAGNIGGGGFMVGRNADGTTYSMDFRETAPAAAFRDMYLDSTGAVIPHLTTVGHRSCGIPGTVAGMFAVHDSLGRLPMARLIQPAIDLALNGYVLTAREAHMLSEHLHQLRDHSTRPSAFTERAAWNVGDTVRLPELAATLTRIRDLGNAGFYEGTTARLMEEEMQRGGGLITAKDLATYKPLWRTPVSGSYRDLEVISMAPPSSGGVVLLQMLKSVELFEPHDKELHRASEAHVMVEAERRAYADRSVHFGDPAFGTVPVEGLLDEQYIRSRMADVDPLHATPSALIASGHPLHEKEQTTHYSIVDQEGNAVSITTTLNGWFGSQVVVGGAGFLLNDEMDDFSARPGIPNAYGLMGGEANSIAAGKRMLSSMAPSIVTRKGKLFMVVGTPGGASIPTTVFQIILDVVDHGMNMQQAVAAPRFHSQWLPDVVDAEPGTFSPADSVALSNMGHVLKTRSTIGRVDAIHVLPDGRLEGGADPRGDDAVGGF